MTDSQKILTRVNRHADEALVFIGKMKKLLEGEGYEQVNNKSVMLMLNYLQDDLEKIKKA